jgi:hypothetical protein
MKGVDPSKYFTDSGYAVVPTVYDPKAQQWVSLGKIPYGATTRAKNTVTGKSGKRLSPNNAASILSSRYLKSRTG